jgi:hypothetical protein
LTALQSVSLTRVEYLPGLKALIANVGDDYFIMDQWHPNKATIELIKAAETKPDLRTEEGRQRDAWERHAKTLKQNEDYWRERAEAAEAKIAKKSDEPLANQLRDAIENAASLARRLHGQTTNRQDQNELEWAIKYLNYAGFNVSDVGLHCECDETSNGY